MTTETLVTGGDNTQAADATQTAPQQTEGQAAGGEQAGQQQAADGQKPQEGQAAEQDNQGEVGAKADEKPAGAPEKYEFKAPEGATYDDAVIGAYSEIAKELNLPQESAQKMLDKVAPVIAERQAEQIKAAQTAWADSAKADKEFGGDKLTENLGIAKQALDTFGTPELKALLNESGLGNHPEIIRAFYRAGKATSGDTFVGGRAPTGPRDAAAVLYGKSQS